MITIICGTNRPDSLSKKLSKYYQKLLLAHHAESQIIDLKDLPEDFTTTALYDNSGKNAAFNVYREMMNQSEKMVFIVPEYNGSFPGVLKSFIDGMKYPDCFKNKIGALVGLSSGVQGAGLALSHLTDIFNYCGMLILPQKPKLAHIEANFKNGEITNKLYKTLLEEQVKAFLEF